MIEIFDNKNNLLDAKKYKIISKKVRDCRGVIHIESLEGCGLGVSEGSRADKVSFYNRAYNRYDILVKYLEENYKNTSKFKLFYDL